MSRGTEVRRHGGARVWARALGAVLWAAAVGCGSPPEAAEEAEEESASVLVQTEAIERGAVAETISAIGQVEFDPTRVLSVPFTEGGEVLDVKLVPGMVVHKGDVVARVGPVPSGALDAQRARVEQDYAKRELERVSRLRAQNLATNADVQNAEKALATSSAELKNLGVGGAKSARELRAPTDGILAQIQAAPGVLAQPGQTAFTIAPADALVVRVGFDPEDAARLNDKISVALTPLFTREKTEPVEAELGRLQSIVDPNTQLVEALVRVPKPSQALFAGERVRVVVAPKTTEDALVVPRSALTQHEGEEGVFVVQEGKAHFHALEIGLRGETNVEARSGVEAGDSVVVAGHSSLDDDTKIRVEDVAAEDKDEDDEKAEAKDDDEKGEHEAAEKDDDKDAHGAKAKDADEDDEKKGESEEKTADEKDEARAGAEKAGK